MHVRDGDGLLVPREGGWGEAHEGFVVATWEQPEWSGTRSDTELSLDITQAKADCRWYAAWLSKKGNSTQRPHEAE